MNNEVSTFRYWKTKKVVEKLFLQTFEDFGRFGATYPDMWFVQEG